FAITLLQQEMAVLLQDLGRLREPCGQSGHCSVRPLAVAQPVPLPELAQLVLRAGSPQPLRPAPRFHRFLRPAGLIQAAREIFTVGRKAGCKRDCLAGPLNGAFIVAARETLAREAPAGFTVAGYRERLDGGHLPI